jgi:hypothetical protein
MSFAQTPSDPKSVIKPRRAGGRFFAIIVALAALAVIAAMWLWMSLLAISVPLLSWQNAVFAGGGSVLCLSVLAALRVAFEDVLEWIWAIVAAIGAVIVAIFWGIMALFGWD